MRCLSESRCSLTLPVEPFPPTGLPHSALTDEEVPSLTHEIPWQADIHGRRRSGWEQRGRPGGEEEGDILAGI